MIIEFYSKSFPVESTNSHVPIFLTSKTCCDLNPLALSLFISYCTPHTGEIGFHLSPLCGTHAFKLHPCAQAVSSARDTSLTLIGFTSLSFKDPLKSSLLPEHLLIFLIKWSCFHFDVLKHLFFVSYLAHHVLFRDPIVFGVRESCL